MLRSIGTNIRKFSYVVSNRTFKILGLQQIAIGADNKSELSKFWVDLLGVPKGIFIIMVTILIIILDFEVGEYKSEVII